MARRRRRGGVVLTAVGVLAAASVACAQSQSTDATDRPVIGILRTVPDGDHDVFLEELRNQGWRPGVGVQIVPADPDELYADVGEARAALRRWRRQGLDLIVAFSTAFAELARQEAPDLPVLFVVNDPPVASGLVSDRERPQAMTGVTYATPTDRTLHLASMAIPGLERLGYLWPEADPAVPGHRDAVAEAAEAAGLSIVEASFASPQEVPSAVAELAAAGVQAVYLASSTGTFQVLDLLEVETTDHRLPTIANTDFAEFAVVVVTPNRAEVRRQLARQAARLLAGSPVHSIPIEDPRKYVVMVNRQQARRLGLPPLPDALLRQADVVQ